MPSSLGSEIVPMNTGEAGSGSRSRRITLATLFVIGCVLVGSLCFEHTLSGDAGIYFTYFKRFYSLPFAYQEDTVSFGTNSALHVWMGATLWELFPEHWIPIAQGFGLACIGTGILLLRGSLDRSLATAGLLVGLCLGVHPLWETTLQLFETGLGFLACCALYAALVRGRLRWGLTIVAFLYLVRPELGATALACALFIGHRMRWRSAFWKAMLWVAIPSLAYHAYMLFQTGELIPSSLLARSLRMQEEGLGWWESLVQSLRSLRGQSKLMWLALFLLPLATLCRRSMRAFALHWLLIGPVACVYLAFPPGGNLTRYLVPVSGVMMVLIVKLVREVGSRLEGALPRLGVGLRYALLGLPVLAGWIAWRAHSHAPAYDYETMLLADLAEAMDPLLDGSQRVLLYEIQGQYSIDAECLSMDGIVGRQMHAALRGEQSFEEALLAQRVDFIVTMNAMNYRAVYAGTLLERIYLHDLEAPIGARLELPGFSLVKVLSNPAFSDPLDYRTKSVGGLNVGQELRVFGPSHGAWEGRYPFWNSVYRLLPEPPSDS